MDVRIISATNRGLEQDMRDGLFREDLFYRLNVVNFHLPSLAERVEDIPLLANHFLRTTGAHQMGNVTSFAPAAMEVMISSPWPGNVRQLENVVQRTAALSTTPVIPEALVGAGTSQKYSFQRPVSAYIFICSANCSIRC